MYPSSRMDRKALAKQLMENYNPNTDFPVKKVQQNAGNVVKHGEPPIDEFCAEACARKEHNLAFMNRVLSNPENYSSTVVNKAKWLKQLYIMFWNNPEYLSSE